MGSCVTTVSSGSSRPQGKLGPGKVRDAAFFWTGTECGFSSHSPTRPLLMFALCHMQARIGTPALLFISYPLKMSRFHCFAEGKIAAALHRKRKKQVGPASSSKPEAIHADSLGWEFAYSNWCLHVQPYPFIPITMPMNIQWPLVHWLFHMMPLARVFCTWGNWCIHLRNLLEMANCSVHKQGLLHLDLWILVQYSAAHMSIDALFSACSCHFSQAGHKQPQRTDCDLWRSNCFSPVKGRRAGATSQRLTETRNMLT